MSYQRGSLHNRFHVPHEPILRTTRGAARLEGKPTVQEDPIGRSCADRKHPGPAHSPLNQHVFCEVGDRLTTGSATAAPACHRILPLKQDRRFPDTGGHDIGFAQGPSGASANTDLRGCKVLVTEDDFFLAASTRHALREAGAKVLGPVSREDQALSLLATVTPTCALLDINLGEGARFGIADALRDLEVPFMFVTGYDDVLIPRRFNDIGRIRKPSGFRLVVQAVRQMYHSAP
jgi:CheY-like chemotaxis protein